MGAEEEASLSLFNIFWKWLFGVDDRCDVGMSQVGVSRGVMGVKRALEAKGGRNYSRQVLASSLVFLIK